MKKIRYLLISLILMIPTAVNAEVDQDTTVGLFDTLAECQVELAKNDKTALAHATSGYYLSCKEVNCGTSGTITHSDKEPFASNVVCANGNPNPKKELIKTSVPDGHALESGATCSTDEEDEDYFEKKQYATFIDQFNCLLKTNGSVYNSVTTTTTTTATATTTAPNSTTTNPQTGINTYYVILGSTVIMLSIVLYVINKKNLFKKI